jgi:hypothetical protein
VAFFPLNVLMVHSLKPIIVANGNNLVNAGFALGETIRFGSLVFIGNHFSDLSLSPEGNDSGAVFVVMVHNGSLPSHMILGDSSDEGDTALGGGGSIGFPDP